MAAAEGYLGALVRVDGGPLDPPEAGATLEVPLFVLPHVVLLPGATVSLRETPALARWAALDALLRAPWALFAVASGRPAAGEVCCLARVESAARRAGDEATGDEAALVAVARGVARAAVLSFRNGETPLATVRVLPEADRPHQPPPGSAHAATGLWRSNRPAALAARLRAAPALLAAVSDAAALSSLSPAELSWHAAATLPLDARERHSLLQEPSCAVRLHRLLAAVSEESVLCCASCGVHWADGKHVLATGATGAFVNPHGYAHDMLTVREARNVLVEGRPTRESSWFQGHAWSIAHCRSCVAHAGWLFTAVPGRQADGGPHVRRGADAGGAARGQGPPAQQAQLPAAFWGLRQGAFTHAVSRENAADGRESE